MASCATLFRAGLPVVAVSVFAAGTLLAAAAGASTGTLGFDYLAYDAAARRVVSGAPLYDTSYEAAGGFGLYYYPPPFIIAVLPFVVLFDPLVAAWAWMLALIALTLLGSALLPVRSSVRWAIILLAGVSWPFVYALKLGQVGPILFLSFAAGWRSLDRPGIMGVTIALGTIVKLQPALLLGWATATHRWRAVAIGGAVVIVASAAATGLAGTGAWADFASLLGQVGAPVTTPHNFTPGAVLFQAGAPESVASVVQWANVALVAGLALWSWFRSSAEVSYQVTLVASQLVSPIMWDHYAMLLLVPVAYLLERRAWWALVIPIATSLPLLGLVPAATYPVVFWIALIGPLVAAEPAERDRPAPAT